MFNLSFGLIYEEVINNKQTHISYLHQSKTTNMKSKLFILLMFIAANTASVIKVMLTMFLVVLCNSHAQTKEKLEIVTPELL